jgi:methionyl-tRNA formyltransferase
VPALEATARAGEVVLVVAQPDRQQGRGRALGEPAIKTKALALGIPCMQAERPNTPATIAAVAALQPDLFVVVAYGAILSRDLLAVPRLGCVNLHASLLPLYRGASPIQAALLDGRTTTGNSTMWMDEGLDTGDVILQREIAIGPDETAGELSARLSTDGAALLAETIAAIEAGTAPRAPQDHARATVTKKIKKRDGHLDFALTARAVHDRARAMTPWPGALAEFQGQPVRFERTRIAADGNAPGGPGAVGPRGTPGGGLIVTCGEGALEVLRVRPAGKNEMDADAWWRGLRNAPDETPRFTTPRLEEQ